MKWRKLMKWAAQSRRRKEKDSLVLLALLFIFILLPLFFMKEAFARGLKSARENRMLTIKKKTRKKRILTKKKKERMSLKEEQELLKKAFAQGKTMNLVKKKCKVRKQGEVEELLDEVKEKTIHDHN